MNRASQPLYSLYIIMGAVSMENTSTCPVSAVKATNEELAIRYQNGDKSALHSLYEQNRGILSQHSYSYYSRNRTLCARCSVTAEDLQQESFFAIEAAARAFKPDAGYKYTTFLNYHAQNCFNDLAGQRTVHGRREPLSSATSLNEPLGKDESMTLSDAVPDPAAEHELQAIEGQLFYAQLHHAMEMALNRLNDQQRKVLRFRFYQRKTLRETAQVLDCITPERVRQIEGQALWNMRYGTSLRQLRPFMEHLNSWAYTGTGFIAWKESGSVQERIIEKMED